MNRLACMFVVFSILGMLFVMGCVTPGPEKPPSNETNVTPPITPPAGGEENETPPVPPIPPSGGNETNVTPPGTPCTGLSDYDYTLCMAVHTNDVSLCEGNSTCVVDYAAQTKETAPCLTLGTEPLKAFCTSMVENTDNCAPEMGTIKDICYMMLGPEWNDTKTCDKISMDNDYKKTCFTDIALMRKDSAVCAKLGTSYYRDYCYQEYAKATGDVSVCAGLFVESTISTCYSKAALANHKPSLCNNIFSDTTRETCYQNVFDTSDTLDVYECDTLTSPQWIPVCIQYAAIKASDSSLCNRITDPVQKQNCLDKFV